MSAFTRDEIEYLKSDLLGRLATVGRDGTPHIALAGMFSHNAKLDTIDVGGHEMANTKKFRDARRSGRAALVVDDVQPSWQPRGIEIRGRAEAIEKPESVIRIHPERIVSWRIDTDGFDRNSRSDEVA
jgi:pyridoxamine 5'-phosphate oxidase family protein